MKKFPRNNKSYDASKDNWLFEAFADKTAAICSKSFIERYHVCKPSCISEGKIGMGMDDPNENLRITNVGMGIDEPHEKWHITLKYVEHGEFDVTKHFEENIGMGINNPTTVLDNIGIGGVCPSAALDVSGVKDGLDTRAWRTKQPFSEEEGGQPFSEEEEEKFIEELKALHYDLERCKDIETRKNLVEAFATDEFKRIYFMRGCKNKQLDFFIRTWDLQNSDSEYEAFLEEYFN